MTDNLTSNINEQVELVLQQILTLSSQFDDCIYLIYQPQDAASALKDLIAKQPLVPFEYEGYQINYTPGLVALNLTNEQDKSILKQSISEYYRAIDPKAILLAKPRFVYGWIISSLSAEVLAKQLGKVAVQPSHDGDQLLRYFDPAVLSALLTIFSDAQTDKLLNSVYYWLYLDGDGHLVIKENRRVLRKQISSHLGINAQQWQKISWIESRNQALARYRFFYTDQPCLLEVAADKIIFTAFTSALASGYIDKRELSEYAYRSLAIHPNFIEHPIIRSAIKQNKAHSLINQLRDISALQWDIIANECNRNLTGVEQ